MRSNKVRKNIIQSDPIYKSKVITRFINNIMLSGKKSTARTIVYGVLDKLAEDKKDATTHFENALKNLMPKQEVRSKRVGGATYQVPAPLKHDRAEALAIRWLINAARSRKGAPMVDRLLAEVQAALQNEGAAVKKRQDVERMADANKAFSHFKW